MIPVDHQDVQRPVIELIKVDTRGKVRVHPLVVIEYIADYVHGFFRLVYRGIVCDGDIGNAAYKGTLADVLDSGRGHGIVGDGDKVPGQSPYAR